MSFLLYQMGNQKPETLNKLNYTKFESIAKSFPHEGINPEKSCRIEIKKMYANHESCKIGSYGYNITESLNQLLLKGNYGEILTTESESVMEFSILSASSAKPQRDCDIQLFTPCVIGSNESLNLDEMNAHLVLLLEESMEIKNNGVFLLSNISLCLIPQLVRIAQLLSRFREQSPSHTDSTRFLQLSSTFIQELWLPNLASSVATINSTVRFLEDYEEKYTKIETKSNFEDPDVEAIIDKWSKLNYFSTVLLSSLRFKIHSQVLTAAQCEAIARHELMKKLIVTMVLEMSKTFTKIMEIFLVLDLQERFPNCLITAVIEGFLDCTIECRTGEIMIGIAALLESWIKRQPAYTTEYRTWCETTLSKYNRQRQVMGRDKENSEVYDEQDLMFSKWDIGILFLRDILEFTQSEEMFAGLDAESFGWLTVFHGDTAEQESDHEAELEIEPPTIASVNPLQTRRRKSKRAAAKEWAHRSKQKISDKYHKIVEGIEAKMHARRQRILITSIRCYSVSRTDTITADSLCRLNRLTQKLYKKEQKGRRRRDAIKVIFSIT